MNLRTYQTGAVSHLLRNNRAIIQAPAGSGKTIMMAAAVDEYLRTGSRFINRIVVIANTLEQCEQIKSAFARFQIFDRVNQLQICCAAGKPDTADCDLLIVDECHHAPAPMWAEHIKRATGMRWGFTATPFDKDEDRNQTLLDLFGPLYQIGRDTLVNDGHLTKAEVRWLDDYDDNMPERIQSEKSRLIDARKSRMPFLFANPESAAEQEARAHWQAASQIGLCDNEQRTRAIISTATVHSSNSVLILIATIDYGQKLHERLPFSGLCHSKIGKKKRANLIDAFKSGELPILIASTLADEGLDVPCADVLIIGNAGRSATKLEQRTGRVLRPYPGKERGIIYDFRDTFDPMLRAQSYARRRLYNKLKYEQL